VFHDWGEVVTR